MTLTKADKTVSSITLNEGVTLDIPFNENMSIDYSALYTALYEQLVASTTPALGFEDLTISYYNAPLGGIAADWTPLEGRPALGGLLSYPALTTAGTYTIRVSWGGNGQYKSADKGYKINTYSAIREISVR